MMIVVALLAALAWAYLLIGHGGYWRTGQRLPSTRPHRDSWPSVVAVVPARNEEAILAASLPTLLVQDYPGQLRVVLVDDASTDDTAEVARSVATSALTIVPGEGPPPGWAGKVAAMSAGAATAGEPDYLLFTDADIGHPTDSVRALVSAAEAERLDLVSLMARLGTATGWERLVVPAFVYFFAQLYPFRRVGNPRSRTAAAAGGCMLVRREALVAAGGLERIRGALIDDVALGTLIKRRPGGGRTWLGFTEEVLSLRPYPRLADLWGMVARSAYTQLRYSTVLLLGTIIGLLLLYAAPVVATVLGLVDIVIDAAGPSSWWLFGSGLAAWLAMSVTWLPVLRLYRLAPWRAPLLPAVALLYAAMTIDSARRHWLGRGGAWKGRTASTTVTRS